MGEMAMIGPPVITGWAAKAAPVYAPADGSFTPPPSWPVGWWQMGYELPGRDRAAAVEACISAIAQTVAMLPGHHWRDRGDGGRDRITDSPAARVLRRPNAYQTRADFILNLLRVELFRGNGYAVAERERGQIVALHPVPPGVGRPLIDTPTREIFYSFASMPDGLAPEPALETMWPASDVLHLRMHTPRHPLVGATALDAAATAVSTGAVLQGGVNAFMSNMVRPSGYLAVPQGITLSAEAREQLRADWSVNAAAGNQGRLGVLSHGIEWKPLKMDAFDEAVVAAYKMTIADIARVFRVPLPVIQELGGATFNNSETLIRHWHATGLGFVIEHLELALDALFGLPEGEYVEFDVEYILRSDFAQRIDGLTRGIQGGLFSPNEARRREGLPDAEHGDEPRLQSQVVPLSAAGAIPAAPASPTAEPSAPKAFLTAEQAHAVAAARIRSLIHAA